MSVCGHTFCLECMTRISVARHGQLTCPECRKIERVNEPFTPESIARQLVTNALAIPKNKDDRGKGEAAAADANLLPEQPEIEEREATPGITAVYATVFRRKSHTCARCFAHLLVWAPMLLSVLCQPAVVTNIAIAKDLKCSYTYQGQDESVPETIVIFGIVLIGTWLMVLVPFFWIIVTYNGEQVGCGKLQNLFFVLMYTMILCHTAT